MGENQESPEVQKKPEAGTLDRLTNMIAATPLNSKTPGHIERSFLTA